MPTVRTIPNATYYVHGRKYSAGTDGLIEDVRPDDVPALINAGAMAVSPWQHPAPSAPAPAPRRPKPAMVKLKCPPYASYQPRTGHRYTAQAEGFIEVEMEDVPALCRAGCVPVDPKAKPS